MNKKVKNTLKRAIIIVSLALFGLVVRVLFFSEYFTRTKQTQAFFASMVGITIMWRGTEYLNMLLNKLVPYSKGIMRRILIQLIAGQVFFYGVLFILTLAVLTIIQDITINKEIIFSGLLVYLFINLAANGGLIGNHFFLEWKKSLIRQERLEKEKAEVHFENLKNQLNPHFLFNSLSSLNSLITENPELASQFLKQLSKVYRYLLENNHTDCVALETEVNFVQNYISLLKTRFGKGLEVEMVKSPDFSRLKIIPVTLQILIENAIKHNITYEDRPLKISVYIEDGYLVVKNNHQPKTRVEGSNKKGLDNLSALYHYTTGKEVIIENTNGEFTVKVPLIDESSNS